MGHSDRSIRSFFSGSQVGVLLRFCAVGVLTAGIYAAALAMIVEVARQRAAFGAAVAYVFAVSFNCWAHRVWTYRSNRSHHSAGPRYILVIGLIFCIDVLATALLPRFLGVSYSVVQVGLAVIIAGITFVVLGRWVSSQPYSPTRHELVTGNAK